MTQYNILFSGTTGAGKTTAVASVSQTPPLSTDTRHTSTTLAKEMTTLGLDYGELTLDNGEKLRLYDIPGQQHFNFMWKIVSHGALGLVILIDNRQPDPLSDLSVHVARFRKLIDETACVVAVGHMQTHSEPCLKKFTDHLQSLGVLCPVLASDVRDSGQVMKLLGLLLLQVEVKDACLDEEAWSTTCR